MKKAGPIRKAGPALFYFCRMKRWENIRFKTGEDYFNLTQTIFYLLVMVPLSLFAWSFLEAQAGEFTANLDEGTQNWLLILLPLAALGDTVAGHVFYFRLRAEARKETALRRKLEVLFRANIWLYAGLTTSTLIIALGMYLTQQEVMGAWAGTLLFVWSLNVPTRQRFGRALRLSRADREKLVYKGEIE